MKLDERGLRALFNDAQLQAPRKSRGCPPTEALASAAEGRGRAADRERLADHLAVCPDCAAEYRTAPSVEGWAEEAASALGRAAERPAPATSGGRPRILGLPVPLLAAAAVVALAVGLVLTLRQPPRGSDAAERGGASEALATIPPDHAVLREAPAGLAWPAVPGASSYRAVLYDSESTPLWKSDSLGATEVALPAAVRERLRPGAVYLWRSFARVGVDERASTVFEFTLSSSP